MTLIGLSSMVMTTAKIAMGGTERVTGAIVETGEFIGIACVVAKIHRNVKTATLQRTKGDMKMINEQQIQQAREQFVVDTKEKASWALRKLAKIRKAKAENEAIAQAEIQRTQEWLEKENKDIEQDEQYFTNLLNLFHTSVLEEDPKAKTIKLPFGKLKAVQQQPDYIRNEEVLLNWAKLNRPEAVKLKESTDWASIKKTITAIDNGIAIDEDGQVVIGVQVVDRGLKLSVEVND